MPAMLMEAHSIGTLKIISWHDNQLNNDLKKKPRWKKTPSNWKDMTKLHTTLEEDTKDTIAQRFQQCPFSNEKKIAEVAKNSKIDLRVG